MKKVYKLNEEWLDLLLENKDNENASFMLSDNDTRILLTYIEILQNRIDKAIEFTKKERKRENNTQPKDILDQQFKNGFTIALAQVEDILKESGEQ